MTLPPAYFSHDDQDNFLPTSYAQSRWGEDHLNGPAVVGLAARALEEAYGLPDFQPTRLTVDLVKAARGTLTVTRTRMIRDGRRVRNTECEIIQGGVTVARAIMVQYRHSSAPAGEEWRATTDFLPLPEIDAAQGVYVASAGAGWTGAIAQHQNAERKCVISHTVDVVADRPNTPFVRASVAAEATSLVTNLGTRGIGYINGDLTMALARLPEDGWIGVQADSHWAAAGIATGTATLFDHVGAFGSGLTTAVSNPAAQIDFANERFPLR